MTEKIGNVVLDMTYYPGEDHYSDGDIEDELLQVAMEHEEEEFPKIIEERKSWPFFYHLSPFRTNIIDWLPFKKTDKVLEIGSGCGAITGALAKRAGSVTCIDLSKKRSLVNAYRNKKQDNITIMVGNFKDIEPHLPCDYDYVLLIGVFEYGRAYIGGETPYEDFMSICNRHRKDSGRLVIAIENKFGLKYWAGCTEDHFGTLFEGLEGYPRTSGVKTFTQKEFRGIIQAALPEPLPEEAWKRFFIRQESASMPFIIHTRIINSRQRFIQMNICQRRASCLTIFVILTETEYCFSMRNRYLTR